MLIAILNCCTKEELEEEEETPMAITPEQEEIVEEEETSTERRQVIKNKILAVGRMSRVFALLRCVSALPQPGTIADAQRGVGASVRAQEHLWLGVATHRSARIGSRGHQGGYPGLR